MSKEKELLKKILANTQAIMDHLKINAVTTPDQQPAKEPKPAAKSAKPAPSRPVRRKTKK